MSAVGRWTAIGATVMAIVTLVTWNRGDAPAEADATPTTTMPVDGAQLFRAKGCAACHDGPETRAVMVDFPSLADVPAWAGDRRPGLSAEEYVAESIRSPSAFISPEFRPGGATDAMPDLRLSEAEIAAVVAYLLSDQ